MFNYPSTKMNMQQVLNDAKEYLKTMQKSKDFTKASKKEWAELANTVKESLNFDASKESIQNLKFYQ